MNEEQAKIELLLKLHDDSMSNEPGEAAMGRMNKVLLPAIISILHEEQSREGFVPSCVSLLGCLGDNMILFSRLLKEQGHLPEEGEITAKYIILGAAECLTKSLERMFQDKP